MQIYSLLSELQKKLMDHLILFRRNQFIFRGCLTNLSSLTILLIRELYLPMKFVHPEESIKQKI